MSEYSVIIGGGRIYTPGGWLPNGHLAVRGDGTIAAVSNRKLPGGGARVVNLDGQRILPGLIDMHVHGGAGLDFMQADHRGIEDIARFHASHGTTSLLATTNGGGEEDLARVLGRLAASIRQGTEGAEVVGIHLEGPFLNAKRKGAFREEELRHPTRRELERYLDAAGGHLRAVTLAPELPGGFEAISLLSGRGVTVSIGHSDATYEEAAKAARLGASQTTHHFNGMSPLHHREPGVAGAGLALASLTLEFIPDGIHLHPEIVKLLYDVKGALNVCAITDAVYCAGLPDGEYDGRTVRDGKVYLLGTDTLAGSTLTAIQGLRNVLRFTGYPLERVLPAFTVVPARQIGLGHRKGAIAPGMDADFLIVSDDLSIESVYVRGREAYRK